MEGAGGAWCDGAVLRFRYADPGRRLAAVRLWSSAIKADLVFRDELGAWEWSCTRPPLWRLDYHLELVGPHGERRSTPPAELRCPDYTEPDWLAAPAAAGTWRRMPLPGLTARIWSPRVGTGRILVAHDGPEYNDCGRLGDYAATAIESGRVRPFHLVLLPPARQNQPALLPPARQYRLVLPPARRNRLAMPPTGQNRPALLPPAGQSRKPAPWKGGERERIYAADPGYARFLARELLPRIRARLGGGPVVGAGVSLGALAMLHAQWRFPESFAGLFLQSGSYFQPRLDGQEAGYRLFRRIARFTGLMRHAGSGPMRHTGSGPIRHAGSDPIRHAESGPIRQAGSGPMRHAGSGPAIPVSLTCGAAEENLANNRDMADSLRQQGYAVEFAENPDAHTWTGWRDALHPHLTGLLRRVWI